MKTSKISKIVSVNERNKWEHWPVFYFTMDLENGETIKLWKKKQDAFKLGDTISYEENGEWRWKEVKEQPFVKKFNSEATNRGAMVWMAIKLAFELVYKTEDDFQNAVVLANRIFDEAMSMYGTNNEPEKTSTNNDNLPF